MLQSLLHFFKLVGKFKADFVLDLAKSNLHLEPEIS
jgi:hypothetical protein